MKRKQSTIIPRRCAHLSAVRGGALNAHLTMEGETQGEIKGATSTGGTDSARKRPAGS